MIKSGENMIITNRIAKNNLHNYLNKNTKLGREVKVLEAYQNGEIELYED